MAACQPVPLIDDYNTLIIRLSPVYHPTLVSLSTIIIVACLLIHHCVLLNENQPSKQTVLPLCLINASQVLTAHHGSQSSVAIDATAAFEPSAVGPTPAVELLDRPLTTLHVYGIDCGQPPAHHFPYSDLEISTPASTPRPAPVAAPPAVPHSGSRSSSSLSSPRRHHRSDSSTPL
jgi:hypothetical protein